MSPSLNPSVAERNMDLLDPVFKSKLESALSQSANNGVFVKVIETVRSQARQDWLYEQGRSRPGKIVTWTHNSKHKDGFAADCIPCDRYGNLIWNPSDPVWEIWIEAVHSVEGLEWGGDWEKKSDPSHIQMSKNWNV